MRVYIHTLNVQQIYERLVRIMVNMIIIDDEPYIHTILTDLLDYKKIGIEITANATNSDEAIRMITPDIKIAVIDIRMPGMSGPDFIEYAANEFPWLKFIVLSGYDDFKYARQVFRYGAIDYFLKSELEPESFKKALKQAVDVISIENTVADNKDKIKSYISKFINKEKPNIEYDDSIREFEKLQRRVIVMKIVDYSEVENILNIDVEEIHKNIDNILNKEFENNNSICIKRFENLYVFVVNTGIMGKSYFEICNKVSKQIKKNTGCNLYSGLSGKFNRISDVRAMYNQAKKAMEYCYVAGNDSLIMYSAYADCTGNINVGEIVGRMREYIHSLQFDKLCRYVSEAFDMTGISMDNIENARQLLSQSYYELKNFISNNMYDKDYTEKLKQGKKLVEYGTVPEYKAWFENELSDLSIERNKYSVIVSKTIAAMYRYYSDPEITLNDIAQNELFVTYNHISRIFKNEVGMSFGSYLTEIRMKKAMELLHSGKYKLYEISEIVGYKNYESFSRTFKSYYDKSPKMLLKGKKDK